MNINKKETKEFFFILIIPFVFLLIMWIVKFVEIQFNLSFVKFGIYPKDINSLSGILFSPFIHKDFTHLFNNSYPILILGSLLFSAYRSIALQIFIWLFFISGFWLWIIGRESYHIGASGMIYSLAAFLFVSGLIRKNPRLAALSMIIIFLYGSLIWGVFPFKSGISWEGHLTGLFAGLITAIFYKNEGPKPKKYQWEIDEELEKRVETENEIKINYIITKQKKP
ncbi:MAG: rhomboid family intramembrane serine protease [Flavobacteriales bacterium]|nr:rhomboid family intramembrane serine protease [Flavobacteriales bacterium]